MPAVNAAKIAAIVLAAGPSSRLGKPKQLLKIDGESLIRRAARTAHEGGCDPVVVVTGAVTKETVSELTALPVHTVFNPDWAKGMGTSIRCGLSAASEISDVDAVVILVCDQPHLNSEIVRDLISAWKKSDKVMAASAYSGTIGPPCCFGKSMFTALRAIGDPDGAKKVLMAHAADVTQVAWPEGSADIDTPEDLKRYQ